MATGKEQLKKPKKSEAPDDDPLSKEARDRLTECRKQKREWDRDIREAYFFAAPHRARELRSENPPSDSKPKDADEQQTGIASEMAADFATLIVNTFMPEAERWAEQALGVFIKALIPAADLAKIEEEIKTQDIKIFEVIKTSDLYATLPMAFKPDLAVGTVGLWIDDPNPGQNFVCQAIPLRELEVNVGPYGLVDDRFIVRHTKNRHVKALIGDAIYEKIPERYKKPIEENEDKTTELRWGFWRKWDRRDDVVWQHVVMVKDDVVHRAEIIMEGSCPLLVMRFNPSPEWAYGPGPLIEALPDLRLYDAIEGDKLDCIENKLRPPTTYPDDSFAAVENGIESGAAYPIRSGSADDIKPIYDGGDIESAMFETVALEGRLRRRFFLDFPEQLGKTPPTAFQFMEELARAQRRIGMPGMSWWREGPAEIFLRFKYLLTKRGIIEPIKADGKTVALTPRNPAQRAAEEQEVAQSARCISIIAGTFPEEFRMHVDGRLTIEAFVDKMRAKLVKMRPEEEVKDAIGQIAQLIEGRQRLEPGSPEAAGPQ